MTDKPESRRGRKPLVVRLVDLAPREDVVGGASKLVFGAGVVRDRPEDADALPGDRSRPRVPKPGRERP